MVNNCRISFSDGVVQEYFDPYLFDVKGIPSHWNGYEWQLGMLSYGGSVIPGTLTKVFPKSLNDPPPGFKAYK